MPFSVFFKVVLRFARHKGTVFFQRKDQCIDLLTVSLLPFPIFSMTPHQLPSHSHCYLEGSVRSGSRSKRTRNDVGAKPLARESLFLLSFLWTVRTSHVQIGRFACIAGSSLQRTIDSNRKKSKHPHRLLKVVRQWIAEAQAASASHVAQQMQQFKLVVFVKVVGISPIWVVLDFRFRHTRRSHDCDA